MKEYLFTATLYIAVLAFAAVVGAPGIGPDIRYASNNEPPGRELFFKNSGDEVVSWSDIEDGGRVEHYSLRR